MSTLGKRWVRHGYNLTGRTFGRLTVIHEAADSGGPGRHRRWVCRCSCGNTTETLAHNLMRTTGATLSCGCFMRESKRIKPFEALYNVLVRRATRQQLCVLTYEEFLPFTVVSECRYCCGPIEWNKHLSAVADSRAYNLDRKDNSVGYTASNLVVCCKNCNYTKGDRFTYEQFLQIGAVIRSFRCPA